MPTNIAVIPDDWENYAGTGELKHGVDPQIIFLDSDVYRTGGHPSIRVEPHTSADQNTAREVNCQWYDVEAGDTVQVSVWVKTTTGVSTFGYPQCGGRLGLDFYGYVGETYQILTAEDFWYDYFEGGHYEYAYVQDANGGAWQQRTINITVPATAKNGEDQEGTVTNIVLWLQAAPWIEHETASNVWFADAEMYINETVVQVPVASAVYLMMRQR
jgi:hypothetical protein